MRTYVLDKAGNRGVWFYSLDSSDMFGVFGARLLYGLRYNFARIYRTGHGSDQKLIYHGQRGNIARSKIAAEWKGAELVNGPPGSLDHFLLERYRFWAEGCPDLLPQLFVTFYNACRLRKVGYEGELFSTRFC